MNQTTLFEPDEERKSALDPVNSFNAGFAAGKKIYEARARRTDPDTSHAAAASVRNVGKYQDFVLYWLRHLGPSTDEQLLAGLPLFHGYSPSGIRSRRAELVAKGLVEYAGYKAVMSTGRMARVWKAV